MRSFDAKRAIQLRGEMNDTIKTTTKFGAWFCIITKAEILSRNKTGLLLLTSDASNTFSSLVNNVEVMLCIVSIQHKEGEVDAINRVFQNAILKNIGDVLTGAPIIQDVVYSSHIGT